MPAETIVRPAILEDSTAIARVQVDSYRTEYAPFFPASYLDHFTYEEQEQDWRDLISSDEHALLYVAEVPTHGVVAYAFGALERTGRTPYTSELVALHVARPYQSRGVGRALIGAVAKALFEQGRRSMLVWVLAGNGRARALYERLGGQEIGERRIGLGEKGSEIYATEVAYGWPDITRLFGPDRAR